MPRRSWFDSMTKSTIVKFRTTNTYNIYPDKEMVAEKQHIKVMMAQHADSPHVKPMGRSFCILIQIFRHNPLVRQSKCCTGKILRNENNCLSLIQLFDVSQRFCGRKANWGIYISHYLHSFSKGRVEE